MLDALATAGSHQARPPIAADLPIPVVYAFISSADPRDCSVVPDEAGGARTAVDHLLAIGRSLVGPPMFGEWREAWGRQATKILLGTEDVDAIFCGSDQIARGVADALRATGRRVPDDVALVGFDNWDVMAVPTGHP
jgi:LacI family transcriptional regulator